MAATARITLSNTCARTHASLASAVAPFVCSAFRQRDCARNAPEMHARRRVRSRARFAHVRVDGKFMSNTIPGRRIGAPIGIVNASCARPSIDCTHSAALACSLAGWCKCRADRAGTSAAIVPSAARNGGRDAALPPPRWTTKIAGARCTRPLRACTDTRTEF